MWKAILINLLVFLGLTSNLNAADACRDREIHFDISTTSTQATLQSQIDRLATCGGGVLHLPPGRMSITTPLILRPGVSIHGVSELTIFELSKNGAIIQNPDEELSGITVSGIKFVRSRDLIKGGSVMTLNGHNRCVIEDLSFEGFKDSSLLTIEPKVVREPPLNAIFNIYRNWYANECSDCIVYQGREGAVISNNSWYDIRLRKVYNRGIAAYKWADSEKWYNLYAQTWDPKGILIDLNIDQKQWQQIDRFNFYSPTLVYAPNLKNQPGAEPVAIRFGSGTLKHFFYGVISDKLWKNFIIDDGAKSYYIQKGSSSGGFKENMGAISKGFDSN